MKRCRAMTESGRIVFFNSKGKNPDGTMIKFDDDSFVKDQQALATSLTQRLSIIKNELWYDTAYGLPLTDKLKSKLDVDVAIADIIEAHPDVINIDRFVSELNGRTYNCSITVNSSFGSVDITI